MTEPTQKPVVHKEAGVAGEPCELNGSTVDQIASAFQDGFTNGNMSWEETPEYHKDMYREGVRSAMSALSSAPVPPVSDGKVEGWQLQFDDGTWSTNLYTERESDEFKSSPRGTVIAYRPLYASPPARHSDEEVERLRAEIARMRGYLERIACFSQDDNLLWWQVQARAALQRDAQGGDTHADHR